MLTQQPLNNNNTGNNTVLPNKFKHLVVQSMDVLESIINNEEVPAPERASIALKILEMGGVSPQTSLPTSGVVESQQLSRYPGNGNYSQVAAPPANGAPTNRIQPTLIQQPAIFIPCSNYISIDNFLTAEENQEALDIAIQRQHDYMESSTTTQANNYRKSSVLFAQHYPELSELIKSKIATVMQEILRKLNHRPFGISEIEIQLTAHNDGCFYKMHNDAGSEKTATRELTYVYYFHKEPKAFSGGELKLYDTELKGSTVTTHKNYKILEPENNRIIFFNSRSRHEVLPVVCPSKAFEDSRFTLNGWIRR
ncbi:MAG: 2OG-Fe(II) oxygenase [Cyanobacteriota bacterium]|nr:2OG-Fe(II) oxygenase [Cyanobacteriota bacterium]